MYIDAWRNARGLAVLAVILCITIPGSAQSQNVGAVGRGVSISFQNSSGSADRGVSVGFSSALLTVFPGSLSFSYQQGVSGPIASKTITVGTTGAPLDFTANATTTPLGGTWLSVTPSGNTSGSNTLRVSVALGLATGTYTGQVDVSSTGASNSPQIVNVTLTVNNPPPPPSIKLICRPVDPVPGYFGAYSPLIARHCYFLTASSTGEQHTYGAYSVPSNGGLLTPLKDDDLVRGQPREPGGCTGPVLGSNCVEIPILRTQTFESIVQGLESAVTAGPEGSYNNISNNCNTWVQRRIDALKLAVTLPDHTIASQADLCREIDNGYLTGVLKSYGVRFSDQVIAFYFGLFACAF